MDEWVKTYQEGLEESPNTNNEASKPELKHNGKLHPVFYMTVDRNPGRSSNYTHAKKVSLHNIIIT